MPPPSFREFLPQFVFDRLTDIRIHDPDRPLRIARTRERRNVVTVNGRLTLLAMDDSMRKTNAIPRNHHTGSLSLHGDYLMRIVRILIGDAIDGIIASMSLLEELLIIHDWICKAGGPPILDQKLMIPTLNHASYGETFEDSLIGPSPAICKTWNMDGAKILLRISEIDAGLKNVKDCAHAISNLNSLGLVTFLEILPVIKSQHEYKVHASPQNLPRILEFATTLGDSSRYLWLQVPYCRQYRIVAQMTTLPILVVGTAINGNALMLLQQIDRGQKCSGNVRGTTVGTDAVFPGDIDPLVFLKAINGIIHKDWTLKQAKQTLDTDCDPLGDLKWTEILSAMEELAQDRWFAFGRDAHW